MQLENIKILGLSGASELTKGVCKILDIKPIDVTISHFADGEILVRPEEPVRHSNIIIIQSLINRGETIELISTDHDAGDFRCDGGDYIKILDWLEEKNISIPIRIHSGNIVGRQNMERIIKHNGWTLIS